MNIVPEIGEHNVIVGKNGSGKTNTSIEILRPFSWVYPLTIVDTKGDEQLERLSPIVYEDFNTALKQYGQSTYIYRPEGWYNEPEQLDLFLQHIYAARRTGGILIDEGYQVTPSQTRPGRGLGNLLMRSRFRTAKDNPPIRMSVTIGVQRPVWVPKQVFTEATRFYVHSLMEDDLKKIAGYVADTKVLEVRPTVEEHDFWYYDVKRNHRKRIHINIGA